MSNDSNDPSSPSDEPVPGQPGASEPPPYQSAPPPPPPSEGYGQPAGYPPPPGYGAQQPAYQTAGGYPPGAAAPRDYSIGDAFSYGWNKFKQNLGPILIIALIALVLSAITGVLSWLIARSSSTTQTIGDTTVTTTSMGFGSTILSGLVSIIGAIITLIITIGIIRAALDITYGRQVTTASVFSFDKIVPAAITYILIGIGTFIGLLLCVIPGLLFAFFAQYAIYFVLDKNLSPVDAIKASFAFVRANAGTLLGFYLVCLLTIFVGYLLCGVGLLVAYPVVAIATAYTYRVLQNEQVAP